MRLAAAEEAADPRTSLTCLADAVEKCANNCLNAISVLAFTHEGFPFATQLFLSAALFIGYTRLTLVNRRVRGRITLKDVFDLHLYLFFAVERNWNCQVVPAVASVKQTIVIVFKLSRKEHDEAALD